MRHLFLTISFCLLTFTSCKSTKTNESKISDNVLLKDIEISNSMKLIGMYPHYDSTKTFQNYNFIIENLDDIINEIENIRIGVNIKNLYTRNEFNIRLIDKGEIVKTWSINPDYSYIRTDGKSYKFDKSQLESLSKKYGFNYLVENRNFNNKIEFEDFYEITLKEDDFLFMYKPNFKYEGEFNVQFPKNDNFKNPKVIIEYLDSKLQKKSSKDTFRIVYTHSDYNKSNLDQYTMTIKTNKKLYLEFEDSFGVKKEWIPEEYSTTIFRKIVTTHNNG